ncbi:MAG TPA: serine/threonine-protein kinase, partial [Planctomycetia bacterium]|nr:serine/threonine-protein kinase [Planctomycetia bacterium]
MRTPPKSAPEFLDLLAASGLLSSKTMDSVRTETLDAKTAEAVARRLVDRRQLTAFQAKQILTGRHRGFFLGRFRILDLLGIGAMGRVYLAEHGLMRRQVALKILPPNRPHDPSSIPRFHREARAIGALNHPNIVQAYDFDEIDGLLFIAMEYVRGKNLHYFVKRHGPIPWPQAFDYAAQAAAALQHAFELGIIHRDIKPGNLLLDRSGAVKVLDMGLARVFGELADAESGEPLSRKFDEKILGTADYLAPEQGIDSHTVDIRADIYALGHTLWYMLTGKAAVCEGTVADKLLWHQRNSPPPIRTLVPELPKKAATVLHRAISMHAEGRYQTPVQFQRAL